MYDFLKNDIILSDRASIHPGTIYASNPHLLKAVLSINRVAKSTDTVDFFSISQAYSVYVITTHTVSTT